MHHKESFFYLQNLNLIQISVKTKNVFNEKQDASFPLSVKLLVKSSEIFL